MLGKSDGKRLGAGVGIIGAGVGGPSGGAGNGPTLMMMMTSKQKSMDLLLKGGFGIS